MKTYPGLPVPEAYRLPRLRRLSRSPPASRPQLFIASLHLCGNTGTCDDASRHRFRGGAHPRRFSLDRLAHLPVALVDARDLAAAGRGIGPERFLGLDVAGKAVLVRTDWSERWSTEDYFEPNPFLTAAACTRLVEAGALFVGIDSLNIDDIEDASRPAHTILLGAGIPVCEHLTNLAAVPVGGGHLHAVPIPWVGGATFPVRAYVLAEDS